MVLKVSKFINFKSIGFGIGFVAYMCITLISGILTGIRGRGLTPFPYKKKFKHVLIMRGV